MTRTVVQHRDHRKNDPKRIGIYRGTKPETSPRTCLRCAKVFQSTGKGNRICSSCRGSSAYDGVQYMYRSSAPGPLV